MEPNKKTGKRRVCIAKNCGMSSHSAKFIANSLTMFPFPTDSERCNAWLKLIGRPEYINNPVYKRPSNSVCSLHFDESDLIRQVSVRLRPDAFPFMNVAPEMPITQSMTAYSSSATPDTEVTTTELQCATDFLETLGIEHSVAYEKILDTVVINENKIDKFAASHLSNDDELSSLNKLRSFIKRSMSVPLHLRDMVKLRDVVLNLFFSNPETYRFLKPSSVLQLPDIKRLSNACIAKPFGSKIDNRIFELLWIKLHYMPAEARYCTLCISEFKLTPRVYYDITYDTVMGLEEVVGHKLLKPAKLAVIATLRGIRLPWLQPISFCFLSRIEFTQIDSWLSKILRNLQTTEIIVQAITVPPTEEFYNFALKKHISGTNPFFKENVRFVFDAPELIRRVRDIFIKKNIYLGTEEVKFEYVRTAYNYGKTVDLSLTSNLNAVHLNPSRNMLSTRVAAQTLSRSVAAALHCYVDSELLPETARATAKFIQTINDAFDLANKRETRCKKKILSGVQINDCIATLNTLSCGDNDDIFNENFKKTAEMFVITVVSVSNIRFMQSDVYGDVNPRQLNLEPLKAMLNRLKTYSNDYTCHKFVHSFRSLCQYYMFLAKKPQLPRREDLKQFVERIDSLPALLPDVLCTKSELLLQQNVDYHFRLPVKDELVYLAAYLLYKCYTKHKCMKMTKMFKPLQPVSNVSDFKHVKFEPPFFSDMRVPTKSFNSYVRRLDRQFNEKLPYCLNLTGRMGSDLVKELDKVVWNKCFCECFPKKYLLTVFVRVWLYIAMKRINKMIKNNEVIIL